MHRSLSRIAIIVFVCSVYVTVRPLVSQAQQVQSVITATGRIVAKRQSNLSFDVPGTVVELPVQEGEHVSAGQLLAREDDAVQQLSFQQADLAAQGAQVALDKLLKPVDARDVANAEAAVKAAEGNYSGLAGAVNPATIKAF